MALRVLQVQERALHGRRRSAMTLRAGERLPKTRQPPQKAAELSDF